MNIGIDFNTKTTKAAILSNGSNVEDCKIFEVKNILVIANGNIFAGEEGFNKFLTEKNSAIYELDQIVELNGLIINKQQISTEKCLSVIFTLLLNKIKASVSNSEISSIVVSIPYGKFYYWNYLIDKFFSKMGSHIRRSHIRIKSQAAAFFYQPNIRSLCWHEAKKKYNELPWQKRFLSKAPKRLREAGYLFVSILQDGINISFLEFDEFCIEIKSTHYTNTVTRRKIEKSVLDYFVSEIYKDSRNFALDDPKTTLRILDAVNEFLKMPQAGNTFKLNLPYVLCKDGEYRSLDTKIDLNTLREVLAPTFNSLVEAIKQLTLKAHRGMQSFLENQVIVCDLFIQQNIKEIFPEKFTESKVVFFGNEKSIATGALNFSRMLTGETIGEAEDLLSLDVIPFSIHIKLCGGKFVEMIEKDTTIPARKENVFRTNAKSKYIEVHLTTKEGDSFQSLSVWKIEAPDAINSKIKVIVAVDADLKIWLEANSDNGKKLSVTQGNTFSLSGTGFKVGIKGKDIRQYVLNQFNYLDSVFSSIDATPFEPDKTFYSMLKEGEPFKALRYLGFFLKLKSLPDVEITESQIFEEQGIAGFISGSKISIPKSFKEDPHGFGYVLAHELAHHILIHDEGIMLDDEQENEILTEIFLIYKGMGKLFLNGFKSTDVWGSSTHSRGYLDEKIIKYIHQIYFQKFNISLPIYKENLTKEAVKILDGFVD